MGLEDKIDEMKIVFYAFLVVASVFAFGFLSSGLLSSGLLSSENSKETALGVFEETSYTLSIRGDTIFDAE